MKTEPSFDRALNGQTITSITGAEKDSDVVEIALANGEVYRMYHSQDCCESVAVHSVVGTPTAGLVIRCEENDKEPDGIDESNGPSDYSHTWTSYFFEVKTPAGEIAQFTIHWLGESNGYYSEDVSFERITL